MNTRELRLDRAKLVEDARLLLKASTVTAENQATATRMLDDADVIKTKIDLEERSEAAELDIRTVKPIAQPNPGANESPEAHAKAEREAFREYIVTGKVTPENARHLRTYNKSTMQVESRDMNGVSNSDGGYLVPTGMASQIESALKFYGPMVTKLSQWRTASGAPIQYPLSDDVSNYAQEMSAIGTDVTESDIPLGQVTFNTSVFTTGLVKTSLSLLQDANFDLESFIRDAFGIRLARGLNKATTLGSTSGNVQGIVGASTVGATSAAPTAISYLDLVATYNSLDSAYVQNASWVFSPAVQRSLMNLEDTLGRALWAPSLTSGVPDVLLGKPIVLNADMVAPAATTISVLFGQLDKYIFRTASDLEVMVLKERYLAAYQRGFVGFARYAGKLLDAGTHPIVNLTQHA